jgi:hypothetical protein
MSEQPFRVERYGLVDVVREDTLPGGSKSRFVPGLISGLTEAVYAGPFCGGGAWALAECGKAAGVRVTLFYAKRKELHRRQLLALKAGAEIRQVPHGYLSNVTAKARNYCADTGAYLCPIGFDCEEAVAAYTAAIRRFRAEHFVPDEVWCATGSGLLARCLGLAFPEAKVCGVVVGLASKNSAQTFTPNVTLHDVTHIYKFERECKYLAPFPCDANYDRKAWELCSARATTGRGRILFWNVAG